MLSSFICVNSQGNFSQYLIDIGTGRHIYFTITGAHKQNRTGTTLHACTVYSDGVAYTSLRKTFTYSITLSEGNNNDPLCLLVATWIHFVPTHV